MMSPVAKPSRAPTTCQHRYDASVVLLSFVPKDSARSQVEGWVGAGVGTGRVWFFTSYRVDPNDFVSRARRNTIVSSTNGVGRKSQSFRKTRSSGRLSSGPSSG